MVSTVAVLLLHLGLLALASSDYVEDYAPLLSATRPGGARKRQQQLPPPALTCEQVYGVGSAVCGAAFCFMPGIGQTCCADGGYCDQGTYCAPVAGYCCPQGEELATCARNAGFEPPPAQADPVPVLGTNATAIASLSSVNPTPVSATVGAAPVTSALWSASASASATPCPIEVGTGSVPSTTATPPPAPPAPPPPAAAATPDRSDDVSTPTTVASIIPSVVQVSAAAATDGRADRIRLAVRMVGLMGLVLVV